MKINRAVIIQCRLSSTRLPQKALKPLGGKPILSWVLESMKKVKADAYYVATDRESYPIINEICQKNGFMCFAGSLDDVLDRYCSLIKEIKPSIVIRATADNPFLFYEAAEDSVIEFENKNKGKGKCDYFTYSNLPHGSGIEVFSANSLLKAQSDTSSQYEKEHVGPALYNHKDSFVCLFEKPSKDYDYPNYRTTVDTYSDYLHAIMIDQYLSKKSFVPPYKACQIVEACESKVVQNPIVLIPSTDKGHGTGHLHRCLQIAISIPSFIYIPKDATLPGINIIIDEYMKMGLENWQVINELPQKDYPAIFVLDDFNTSSEIFEKLNCGKSIISIDEGGSIHEEIDYLLDIIPSFKIERKANFVDTGYIQKPKNVRSEKSDKISNILICIGGEDPSSFTIPCVKIFSEKFPESKITAVGSSINNSNLENNKNISYIKTIPNLKEELYKYDLVVTHYGLTAFESVYAGCAVILLPTTPLHENLADEYYFSHISLGKLSLKKVESALNSKNLYPQKILDPENKPLGLFIQKTAFGKRLSCPVCCNQNSNETDKVVSRNKLRTFRQCSKCGLIYMSWTMAEDDKEYKKSYFMEDYKKQYGKTYEEDFDSIKTQCLRRIENIISIKKISSGSSIFDIGCAYGPFLKASEETGWSPYGTDISFEAIQYVQNKFQYPSCVSSFPVIDTIEQFGISSFDIVTMWYVIEHFRDLDSVLKKVNSLLNVGGIFAFSTPSAEGISCKTDKHKFLEKSPSDHYSIFEPSKVAKILEKYNFSVEKIVSTGHHPERFNSLKNKKSQKKSIKWNILEKISKVFDLGDTVEIYCKKLGDI